VGTPAPRIDAASTDAGECVLVMAYGTPKGTDDVEAYYTDIRGGRAPAPAQLAALVERYEAIGGRSPLLEITQEQARGIEERLGIPAFVGQKHAAPFIADAMEALARRGTERAVGLVLAPHYSSLSVGDYRSRALYAARAVGWEGTLDLIESWHLEPGYIAWLAGQVRAAIAGLGPGSRTRATVVFSAHSLPARILESGDPYPRQLEETAQAVARLASLEDWRVAWQSAGRTSEPWLGPDLLDVVEEVAAGGQRAVVVCPCGFVADHLEVLYDVDIEAAGRARCLGVDLVRTAAPNADAAFLDTLATIVRRRLEARDG
jgi:ferrochelatase